MLQADLLRQQEREVKRVKQELAVDQASGGLPLPSTGYLGMDAVGRACLLHSSITLTHRPLNAPQEAWRAAASDRARREMEGRAAALRRQLEAERDEEIAAVVARLEEDALAKEAQLQVGWEGRGADWLGKTTNWPDMCCAMHGTGQITLCLDTLLRLC